jgi:serine-type D-Ala-D-Ala carboxypeptidase (penicillin-binding protein 5/6)
VKNKLIGIVLSLLVLIFTAIPYYEGLLRKMESENNFQQNIGNLEESNNHYQEETKGSKDNVSATEDKNLKLLAKSAVLMDAESGRVLYEKDGYNEMPMASTTKIMTCIVALENGKLDDVVTISKYASTMPDVQLNVAPGEQYILKDLLYSLMLESHNDVAVAIAEHVGGSVEGFAKLMNKKAKELGCKHTNFVTPNGLDADGHYTTATELAKIASYAIKNEDFINITNTPSHTFREVKKGRTFTVSNKDRFLYMYDGAIGVKTGFTGKAGYCFVGAVKKNGKTFVSAVLGCGWPPHKSYKWSDTTALMNYGMKNFEMRQIFDSDKEFDPVTVVDGRENQVGLHYDGDISLLIGKNEVVKVVYKIPKAIAAPVVADSVVGSAKYYVGNQLIEEVPILTTSNIDRINFKYVINKILQIWMMNE